MPILRFTVRFSIAAILSLFLIFLPFSAVFADATSSLTTLFAYNNQYAGNMFNVTALSADDIVIHSFDVNITSASGENASISVYYRLGGYAGYETNASDWTLAGTTSVVSSGLNTPTSVTVGDFTLTAGQTYGIYITVDNYQMPYIRMYYTNGTTSYQDENLKIFQSIGRGTPDFTGVIIQDRIWNGTIYYSVLSPTPTVTPTITPPIMPNTGDGSGAFVKIWAVLAVITGSIILMLQRKVLRK